MKRRTIQLYQIFYENSGYLIAGTIFALLWRNVDWLNAVCGEYSHFVHKWEFAINDVFMAIFFARAFKEIAESVLLPNGELRGKKGFFPIFGALGGMIMPAGIYYCLAYFFNQEILGGWLSPTATDVAFSVSFASIIMGRKHPAIKFLLLLAVADDGLGVAMMSIVFSQGFNGWVFLGIGISAIILAFITRKKANHWMYFIPSFVIAWLAFHFGGVHPALSPGLIIPFMPMGERDLGMFVEGATDNSDLLSAMDKDVRLLSELTLGLFALVNAGVSLNSFSSGTLIILVSLLFGKVFGIYFGSLLGAKILKTNLPDGMDKHSLLVVAILTSIGFTVSIFIIALAFPSGGDALKLGALLSFVAVPFAWKVYGKKERVV